MFRIKFLDRFRGLKSEEKKKLTKQQWMEEVQDDPGHWKPLGDWAETFEPPPVKKELSERKKARREMIKTRLRDFALNKIHSSLSSRLHNLMLEVASLVLTNAETKVDDVVSEVMVLTGILNTSSAVVLTFRFDTKKQNRKHFAYLRRNASDQLTDQLVPALQDVDQSNVDKLDASAQLVGDLHAIIIAQKQFVRETLEKRIDEMLQNASNKVDTNLDSAHAKVSDKMENGPAVRLAREHFNSKKVQLPPSEHSPEGNNDHNNNSEATADNHAGAETDADTEVGEKVDAASDRVEDGQEAETPSDAENQTETDIGAAVESEAEPNTDPRADPAPVQAEETATPLETPEETNVNTKSHIADETENNAEPPVDEPTAGIEGESQTKTPDTKPEGNTTALEEPSRATDVDALSDAPPATNETSKATDVDALTDVSPVVSNETSPKRDSIPATITATDSESPEKIAEGDEKLEGSEPTLAEVGKVERVGPDDPENVAPPNEGISPKGIEISLSGVAKYTTPKEPQALDSADIGESKSLDSLIPLTKKSSMDSAKSSIQEVKESVVEKIRSSEKLQKAGADMMEKIPDRQSLKKAKSSLKNTKDEIIATFGVQVRELIVSQMEDLPEFIFESLDQVIDVVRKFLAQVGELKRSDEHELKEKVYKTLEKIHEDSVVHVEEKVQSLVDMMGGVLGKKLPPDEGYEDEDEDDDDDADDAEEEEKEEEGEDNQKEN